jgi:hypothetical protein
MKKEQILNIIKDQASQYGWSLEEALQHLATFRFTVDSVVGNALFTEQKVRDTVAFVHRAVA